MRPERWVHVRAQIVPSSVGKRLICTVRDITPKKEAELRQQILNAELQHRVKNGLAMVSAITAQTLRCYDIADRRITFLARLPALSHAEDILTSESRQGAPIQAVVESALCRICPVASAS
jgi:two-component sensor histidine kinase